MKEPREAESSCLPPPLLAATLAGADVPSMLANMCLPTRVEAGAKRTLSYEDRERLWIEAARYARDPAVALHTPQHVPQGTYGVLDYIASNHATLGEGLRATAEYFRFSRAGFGLVLDDASDGSLILRRSSGARPGRMELHRFSTEFTFGMILSRFRESSGTTIRPLRATFTFPEPPHVAAYREFFCCPLAFCDAQDAIVFGADSAALPQPNADTNLRVLIEASAELLAEGLPATSTADRLRRALPEALSQRTPTAAGLARNLGLSARTLQRRLAHEGTSFQQVLGEARFQLSLRYLADATIAISEVAYLLGFSDVRAFSRAFKRWSGRSPTQWRSVR